MYLKLLLIAIFFMNSAQAELYCNSTKLGDHSYYIQVHNYSVTILGWEHVSPIGGLTKAGVVQNIEQAFLSDNCHEVTSILNSGLATYDEDIKNANVALEELKEIQKRELHLIGIEFTKKEVEDILEVYENRYKLMFSKLKNCVSANTVKQYQLLLFGPGIHFHINNPEIGILPLEEEKLKTASSELVSQLESFPRKDFEEEPSERTNTLFSEMDARLQNFRYIPDSEISLLLDSISNLNDRNYIMSFFNWYKQMAAITLLRSNRSAEIIAESQKNVVVIIGEVHAEQMSDKLVSICSSTTKQ